MMNEKDQYANRLCLADFNPYVGYIQVLALLVFYQCVRMEIHLACPCKSVIVNPR